MDCTVLHCTARYCNRLQSIADRKVFAYAVHLSTRVGDASNITLSLLTRFQPVAQSVLIAVAVERVIICEVIIAL